MDAQGDVYQCLLETIRARLGEPAGAEEPPQEADPDELRREAEHLQLRADAATVRLHARVVDQPVTYGQAAFCPECGEPAPCPVVRGLAERYGCDDAAAPG